MARTTEVKLSQRSAQRSGKGSAAGRRPAVLERAGGALRSPAIFRRIFAYLREVWVELNRVDWPSRRELISMTIVVVVVLLVMSVYLGLFDYIYTVFVKRLLMPQQLR